MEGVPMEDTTQIASIRVAQAARILLVPKAIELSGISGQLPTHVKLQGPSIRRCT